MRPFSALTVLCPSLQESQSVQHRFKVRRRLESRRSGTPGTIRAHSYGADPVACKLLSEPLQVALASPTCSLTLYALVTSPPGSRSRPRGPSQYMASNGRGAYSQNHDRPPAARRQGSDMGCRSPFPLLLRVLCGGTGRGQVVPEPRFPGPGGGPGLARKSVTARPRPIASRGS